MMNLLNSYLNTHARIKAAIKCASLLTLQLVMGSSAPTPSLLEGWPLVGASGDLTFTVQSGATHSSCLMDFSHETDNIVVESTSGCNGPFSTFRLNPRLGSITLFGGQTYHLSSAAVRAAFIASNCLAFTLPLQLRQFECDDGESTFSAEDISPSSWSVTCTAEGICATTSSEIIVTLP